MVVVNVILSRVEFPPSDGVLAACTKSKTKTTGAYHGFVVCSSLPEEPLSIREYGEGTLEVLISIYNSGAIALPNMVTDRNGIEQSCSRGTVQFCAMGYINCVRYLTVHNTLGPVRQLWPT